MENISISRCRKASVPRSRAEVFPEMFERAGHGKRGHAAQAAQRALQHDFAQLLELANVTLRLHSAENPVDHLDTTRRAYAARGAFTARLFRAELQRITRHARHI